MPELLPQIQPSVQDQQPIDKMSFSPVLQESSINAKLDEPVFVRIDKFNGAKDDIQTISKKLKDMDKILEKISEVREKEENEINGWKDNIKEISEYLSRIDRDVFNKI